MSEHDRPGPYDVLIAGGGVVGLTLAVALKASLGDIGRIIVCDPDAARTGPASARASAVAAGPRHMLEALGVWPALGPVAQPIRRMVITDSRLGDAVRPSFLRFGGAQDGDAHAHMVMNADMVAALRARAAELGVTTHAARVTGVGPRRGGVEATLDDGASVAARLIVAADGAQSRLRGLARIGMVGWTYDQVGIVATISHERPHDGVAYEHFLPAGPFAILPLQGDRSSIVWTERKADAPDFAAVTPGAIAAMIAERFGLAWGALRVDTPPRAFPLDMRIARRFAGDRLALLGDAAHTIHPIAGQGLNLGLRGVAALAEAIVAAMRVGGDPGAPAVLARYERARRFDTIAMAAVTDGLNRLFANESTPLRLVRDLGLGLVDRAPALKAMFMREAAGATPHAPPLLRGERL